jgi:hypothetical protein
MILVRLKEYCNSLRKVLLVLMLAPAIAAANESVADRIGPTDRAVAAETTKPSDVSDSEKAARILIEKLKPLLTRKELSLHEIKHILGIELIYWGSSESTAGKIVSKHRGYHADRTIPPSVSYGVNWEEKSATDA